MCANRILKKTLQYKEDTYKPMLQNINFWADFEIPMSEKHSQTVKIGKIPSPSTKINVHVYEILLTYLLHKRKKIIWQCNLPSTWVSMSNPNV